MAENQTAYKPSYGALGYDKIFVALDGTPQQELVLARAIIIASTNEAELYIGHVIDSSALETSGSYPTGLLQSLEKQFRESIAPQVAEAEAAPGIRKVEVMVKAGRIRETIKEDMLEEIQPDLVICGARGLSNIKYALLGSISTFLVRNAKCDTLVLK
jgi:nucleotide-binding universal stress UspA family protein